MSTNLLHLKIVTPEKEIFDSQVEIVNVTTPKGEIGVLPNHMNLMSLVIPGELRIKDKGKEIIMATGTGMIQVADNTAVITIDSAEKAEDINEKMAEEAKKRAEEAMQHTQSDEEYAIAASTLEKALAKLKVKRRHFHP